jgi:hypothetical protein
MGGNKMGGPNATTYHFIFRFIILGNGPHLSALPYTRKTHQINPNSIPHLLVRIDKKIFLKSNEKNG